MCVSISTNLMHSIWKAFIDADRLVFYPNINPTRPGSRQINSRQFKMTTFLERFIVLVPYFMTFSFQVFCMISEKTASIVLLRSCSSRSLPVTQNPRYRCNFFVEINKCALVYSFSQYYKLSMINYINFKKFRALNFRTFHFRTPDFQRFFAPIFGWISDVWIKCCKRKNRHLKSSETFVTYT